MNSTSFFYNHSSQWRYETVGTDELLSPLADKSRFGGSLIDFNVRAERMGWLPSAPQLSTNPLRLAEQARAADQSPVEFTVDSLKNGSLGFAAEQPDNPQNFPRNLFVWRSNLPPPARAMSTCSNTCWAPKTAFRGKISASRAA